MRPRDLFKRFEHLLIEDSVNDEPLAYVESNHWLGRKEWKTSHGPAICHWMLYRPIRIDSALLPDGTRGMVQNMWTSKGWRRRATQRGYVWGNVELTDEDAVFADSEGIERVFMTPQDGTANLEADLHESEMMLWFVQDDRYAWALNYCFHNTRFVHEASEKVWYCTMRKAGGIVAELRGLGESYLDFYSGESPYGRDDEAHREVLLALQTLGWIPLP